MKLVRFQAIKWEQKQQSAAIKKWHIVPLCYHEEFCSFQHSLSFYGLERHQQKEHTALARFGLG